MNLGINLDFPVKTVSLLILLDIDVVLRLEPKSELRRRLEVAGQTQSRVGRHAPPS
jgi:hypothetical protein